MSARLREREAHSTRDPLAGLLSAGTARPLGLAFLVRSVCVGPSMGCLGASRPLHDACALQVDFTPLVEELGGDLSDVAVCSCPCGSGKDGSQLFFTATYTGKGCIVAAQLVCSCWLLPLPHAAVPCFA